MADATLIVKDPAATPAVPPAAAVVVKPTLPPTDSNYYMRPGENAESYAARVKTYNDSKSSGLPSAPTLGTSGALATNVSNAISSVVPSTVLSSQHEPSAVLSRATELYKTYDDTLKTLKEASTPSAAELDAENQIRDVNTKLAQGIAKIRSQAIPTALIGAQSEKLQSDIASIVKPLQDEVDSMVRARGAKVDAITSVLQATPQMLQLLGSMQQLTKPDSLGTQTNQTTGDVYSIVQDADGNISTQKVGNIGLNNTGKAYVQSGVYQAGDGKQYFYGVKTDGTIDNVLLQGAGTGGGGGGTFSQTQLNNGASNAQMSIADFKNLPADDKNFFINGYSEFTKLQDLVTKDQMTKEEAAQRVKDSPYSQTVKAQLLNILGVGTASASTGGGSGAMSFLGNALGVITNPIGSIGSAWSALKNTLGF